MAKSTTKSPATPNEELAIRVLQLENQLADLEKNLRDESELLSEAYKKNGELSLKIGVIKSKVKKWRKTQKMKRKELMRVHLAIIKFLSKSKS